MQKCRVYRPHHYVIAATLGNQEGRWWVSYANHDHNTWPSITSRTGFDLNIHLDYQPYRTYLLTIRLCENLRGQGLGSEMYSAVERIAWRTGCELVEQFPSGVTYRGDERADYLVRRGWEMRENGHAVKYRPQEVCDEEAATKLDLGALGQT